MVLTDSIQLFYPTALAKALDLARVGFHLDDLPRSPFVGELKCYTNKFSALASINRVPQPPGQETLLVVITIEDPLVIQQLRQLAPEIFDGHVEATLSDAAQELLSAENARFTIEAAPGNDLSRSTRDMLRTVGEEAHRDTWF
ncbi:MAG: hypothetical protein K2W82_16360 [Candidatus Obscuribacterales bacterium]|nr:hypothetical protein [Candidatus Obscuribacterales bacterium]